MDKTTDGKKLSWLAQGLSALLGHLEPPEAEKMAALLVQTMGKTTDRDALSRVAQSFSEGSVRLETPESSRHCASAAALLVQAMGSSWSRTDESTTEDISLSSLSGKNDSPDYRIPPVDSTGDILASSLAKVMTFVPRSELAERTKIPAVIVGLGAARQPLGVLSLMPTVQPLPCRFSTQELIELLKHPLCVGRSRTVVLKHLGNRYRRPFASVWEFLRFAREHQLDIDLTTPPRFGREQQSDLGDITPLRGLSPSLNLR